MDSCNCGNTPTQTPPASLPNNQVPIILSIVAIAISMVCLLTVGYMLFTNNNSPPIGEETIAITEGLPWEDNILQQLEDTWRDAIIDLDKRLVGSWDIIATYEWIRRYIFYSDGTGRTQLLSQVIREPVDDALFVWSTRGGVITMYAYHYPINPFSTFPYFLEYSIETHERGEDILTLSAFPWEHEGNYMLTLMRSQ